MSQKLQEHERQPLGEALSAYLEEHNGSDWCDSRDVDLLIDAVIEPWLRGLKVMPAMTGVEHDQAAFEKYWVTGHKVAPAKYVDGTYKSPAAYSGWTHWQAACRYMRPKTSATEVYPYCYQCQRPFVFERDEPFAYCGCGTTEWGNAGRPKHPIFSGPDYTIQGKSFREVWATMEAQGYKYGEDALTNVMFGWELAFHAQGPQDPK